MSDDLPCHYVNDPQAGRVLIPGCMGAAVYGRRGCTCPKVGRETEMEIVHKQIARLEKKIKELERSCIKNVSTENGGGGK